MLEVGGGIAEVIATAGDGQLGGDDFDQVRLTGLKKEKGASQSHPRAPAWSRQVWYYFVLFSMHPSSLGITPSSSFSPPSEKA